MSKDKEGCFTDEQMDAGAALLEKLGIVEAVKDEDGVKALRPTPAGNILFGMGTQHTMEVLMNSTKGGNGGKPS